MNRLVSKSHNSLCQVMLVLSMALAPFVVHAEQKVPPITVFKSPTCGCCEKWITHLQKQGFVVEAKNSQQMPKIKAIIGVKPEYQSCHTAIIGGYYIEGHVPADDIKRLLKEKPDAIGLSVPGMHVGSPGMEQGNQKERYTVFLIKNDGKKTVYHQY